MLEKIFQKSKFNSKKPMIFTDCTLFFGLDHFDIDNTYIFQNQKEYEYSTVGEMWIDGRMRTEYSNIGYFSTNFYSIKHFGLINHFIENENKASIIGYYKNERYIVSGISINKETSDLCELAVKFDFLEMEKLPK